MKSGFESIGIENVFKNSNLQILFIFIIIYRCESVIIFMVRHGASANILIRENQMGNNFISTW